MGIWACIWQHLPQQVLILRQISPFTAAAVVTSIFGSTSHCRQRLCTVSVVLQKTKPIFIRDNYKGADKLKGKVAIITGG